MGASMLRRTAVGALLLVAAGAGYLAFWPVPAEPRAWSAPQAVGYVGAYAPNTRPAVRNRIDLGEDLGPEPIAIGPGVRREG